MSWGRIHAATRCHAPDQGVTVAFSNAEGISGPPVPVRVVEQATRVCIWPGDGAWRLKLRGGFWLVGRGRGEGGLSRQEGG